MKIIISILFSPMAFALGFLWPLFTQLIVALQLASSGWPAILTGAAIATSWVWIK